MDADTVAPPWARPAGEVMGQLATSSSGLTSAEAAVRLDRVGPNELDEQRVEPVWRLFVRQFTNTMIAVLAVAAAITWLIGDRTDTVVIAAIVVLNAVVGFLQERRAAQAMAALKRMTTAYSSVVRDGVVARTPTTDLVPGDIVHLAAGDIVPADLRLLEVEAARIDEAALTGESEPIDKSTGPLPGTVVLGDRLNMAHKGTAMAHGRATGVVVATGMATELGRIAGLLDDGDRQTPLQRRLARLGRRLAAAAVVVCTVVFAAGALSGEPLEEMFVTAVSLAVAAIPEGLPAVVTIALALGARRMATRRAVIRRLPAVEALGAVEVICTDKTGTLTQNRMTVERVWTPSGTARLEGRGYDPVGSVDRDPGLDDRALQRVADVAAACNDAVLTEPEETGDPWGLQGDPTEGALAVAAARIGTDLHEVATAWRRVGEVAFDATRRRMTTVHERDGRCYVAVKGAVEALLPLLRAQDRPHVAAAMAAADDLAAAGYRVLAIADRVVDRIPDDGLASLETDLRLCGLVGIADAPRPEAAEAVATCRAAGITAVMITGDHPRTAEAIGRRLGMLDEDREDGAGQVCTGQQLDAMDHDELAARIADLRIFARTSPEQKLRIVDAWRARGAVVAMTGDGVNDAPALQRSDIGVAMGIAGTDVSREAADIVLTDDNFATIVAAVEEGRRIYDNIRRFVRYLLTTNTGEILVMLLALLAGLPVPLIATQILWINLVTDGLPAVALGLEPVAPGTMRRPPRPPDESILGRGLWQHVVWVGALMAATCLALLVGARAVGWPWQTMVFTTLALLQLGHALATRSETLNLRQLGVGTNLWLLAAVGTSALLQLGVVYVPALQDAFDTVALGPLQLFVVVVLGSVVFVAVESEKWWRRRTGGGDGVTFVPTATAVAPGHSRP